MVQLEATGNRALFSNGVGHIRRELMQPYAGRENERSNYPFEETVSLGFDSQARQGRWRSKSRSGRLGRSFRSATPVASAEGIPRVPESCYNPFAFHRARGSGTLTENGGTR